MFIPFGELGLGKLNQEQKRAFIAFLESSLAADEKIEPINEAQMVRKGMGWDTASKAADAVQLIGFIYFVGKGAEKKLRDFFKIAKKWVSKNNVDYDTDTIKKIADALDVSTDELME